MNDIGQDLIYYIIAMTLTQIIALAATILIWSIGVFIGLGLVFTALWKFFAVLGAVVAVLAVGQVKFNEQQQAKNRKL